MRLAGLVANGYTTNETFKFLLDRPIKRRRQAPGFRGNLYGDCSASGSTGGRRQRRGDSRAKGDGRSLSGSGSTGSRRQRRGDSRTEGDGRSLSSSGSTGSRRQWRGDSRTEGDRSLSSSGSTRSRRQGRGDSRTEGECSLSGSCSTRSRRQWRGDSRTEGECSLSSSSSASGRRQGRGDAGAKHDTRCGAIGALLSRNGGSACKCSGSADGEKKYGKRHTCGQKINFFHGKSPCAGQNYIQSTPKV